MDKEIKVGTLVSFVDKNRNTLKGKVLTMGEHLPNDLQDRCVTVEAKPFIPIGDDMDVSCIVLKDSLTIVPQQLFDNLPWCRQSIIMKKVHISTIKIGDTILHDGEVRTVGGNNIKHSGFMGISLFGDSYNLGYKLVTKIEL